MQFQQKSRHKHKCFWRRKFSSHTTTEHRLKSFLVQQFLENAAAEHETSSLIFLQSKKKWQPK
ncbi:MAG: hypothetical protein UDB15_00080 [Ruminococcus sp.]|nr:hypothetical protein [Ruminococcus sp.]